MWGSSLEDYPYLKGVTDPYEADLSGKNPYSSWTVSYSEEELVQRLLSKGYAAGSGIDSLELTYSELGNVIQVKVFYENGQSNTLKPEKIRSAFGLREPERERRAVRQRRRSAGPREELFRHQRRRDCLPGIR